MTLDHSEDFAVWTARRWATLVPEVDSGSAALVAIRLREVFEALDASQRSALAPWSSNGIKGVEDFRTVALLRHTDPPGLSSQRIASLLRTGKGTISARVDRLDGHGFIIRNANPADRRSTLLLLEPSAASMVDNMYRALVENHRAFFGGLDTDDHHSLAHLLTSIGEPRLGDC